MNKNSITTRQIVVCGLIAALYTALGVVFAPIGFGPVQARVAEAMTLLPLFTPYAPWGLAVGCAITNAYGISVGASILGIADVVFGTAATLVAAWMTRMLRGFTWRGIPVWAVLPPILVNALVVGGELTVAMGWSLPLFCLNAVEVGLGQLVACGCIGLPMAVYLLRRPALTQRIFGQHEEIRERAQ